MPVCWSCAKVKGKRVCPARGGELICSKCCGTKRRVEIRCPPDCTYLHGGQDAGWSSESRQKEEARFLAHFLPLEERRAAFLFFLHHVLQTSKSELNDAELEDVLASTRKTLETASKGIVYQHPAESPQLEPIVQWLGRVIEGRTQIEGAPTASDEDVIAALAAMQNALAEHRKKEEGRERYLDMVRRVLGKMMAEAPPLELPAELDEPPRERLVSP